MLKVTSGKKIKERVCNKCEELIDNDDHALPGLVSEQEYHAGMGKFLDDSENDAGVANRSLSFVKYDGISTAGALQASEKEQQQLHVHQLSLSHVRRRW